MGDYQPKAPTNDEPILPEKWRGREIVDRPESDEDLEKLPIGTLLRVRNGEIWEYRGSIKGGINGKKVHKFKTPNGQTWENLWPHSEENEEFFINEHRKKKNS